MIIDDVHELFLNSYDEDSIAKQERQKILEDEDIRRLVDENHYTTEVLRSIFSNDE